MNVEVDLVQGFEGRLAKQILLNFKSSSIKEHKKGHTKY